MASFLESMITKVQIKTAYGPDLVLNKPFAPSPPGTNPVAAALKPRVEVFVSGAAEPLVMQPYGKPPPTKWPTIVAVGGASLGLLLILSTIGASTVVKRRRGLAGLGGHMSMRERHSKKQVAAARRTAKRLKAFYAKKDRKAKKAAR